MQKASIPLGLYIHFPWCVRKCPYCDFNSHAIKIDFPEKQYIQALLTDLQTDLKFFEKFHLNHRKIHSIFMGGGTPSLFSPESIGYLLKSLRELIDFENDDIEITLEANPGAIEQEKFEGFRKAGVNRLSMGIQSFDKNKLKKLGRIHDDQAAIRAVSLAREAGFVNFNIDLMHGLPSQTLSEALADIQQGLEFLPPHISWYQLTLEPNTLFYQKPPLLPAENILDNIEKTGFDLFNRHGYKRYEISAYCQENFECRHNLNYWQFGDYLGIGTGAHGKITDLMSGEITRTLKPKHPKNYLENFISNKTFQQNSSAGQYAVIDKMQMPFEFMLNALRLQKPISWALLQQRTQISESVKSIIQEKILALSKKNLMRMNHENFEPTLLGRRFLNNILTEFIVS